MLIQHAGLNVLTDPHWSRRAAPFQWAGPARFTAPGIAFHELPSIDVVLLSHDHYDHLDEGTVRRIQTVFGPDVQWFTPLGYRTWLSRRGVRNVTELDWWSTSTIETEQGSVQVQALPAQHWTRRGIGDEPRLWSSWSIGNDRYGRIYFGGDSGYFDGFRTIGEEVGPFRASLLPIGAYDPRWFMEHDHMNPEEAIQAYVDLGGEGLFAAIHWGTFRLTDEDPLEPPVRARAEWERLALRSDDLWIPRHGETWLGSGQDK